MNLTIHMSKSLSGIIKGTETIIRPRRQEITPSSCLQTSAYKRLGDWPEAILPPRPACHFPNSWILDHNTVLLLGVRGDLGGGHLQVPSLPVGGSGSVKEKSGGHVRR